MYYKSRKYSALRMRIKEQLLALGWAELPCPCKPSAKNELHGYLQSPHVLDGMLLFENRLKRINPVGEAYYALEHYGLQLTHLAWRCNTHNPNNHNPLDTFDASEEAHDILINGIDFDYYEPQPDEDPDLECNRHIRIIDWEHPERNTFEFVQGWRGAENDGFGWDFVLLVNAIPVGAILLQPDEEGAEPCRTALELAQKQLGCDCQFPVYCHALVVGNGKQLKVEYPWCDLDDFKPITDLKDALSPEHFLLHSVMHYEF